MDLNEMFIDEMDTVITMIEDGRFLKAREAIIIMEPADIGLLLDEISREHMLRVFRMLPKNLAADTFAYMKSDQQKYIIESITDKEINNIMDELFMDDTVDFLEEMPANVVHRVLANTDRETRRLINQMLQYPEDSAGAMMTTEFVDLKKEMTVREAMRRIRVTGKDSATLDTCYVIDRERKLEGDISLRKIILSPPDAIVSDLMNPEAKHLHTSDDQENTAYLFKKYDLMTMPVVDGENRLVGIITIDDIVDVIEQEATEDIEIMAAMTPSDKPYTDTSSWETFKQRIPWLLILMLSSIFTAGVLASYESSLAAFPALIAFIPMFMGTGGNAGGQASVAVIRSLALNEVDFSDIFKVAWKELRTSLICGVVIAVVCFLKTMLLDARYMSDVTLLTAVIVSITIFLTVVFAELVGCIMPLLAKKVGFDPAVMASPFITTIVDALSLVIYFQVVRLFLPI